MLKASKSKTKVRPGANDLLSTNPELSAEWNLLRNGALRPQDVSPKDSRVVWWWNYNRSLSRWIEWQAAINYRVSHNKDFESSNQPPYRIMAGRNDLATTHPFLAREWDDANPREIARTSAAMSASLVNWICPHCKQSFSARPKTRIHGYWCPRCRKKSGKKFDLLYQEAIRQNINVGIVSSELLRPDIILSVPWTPERSRLHPSVNVNATITLRYINYLEVLSTANPLKEWVNGGSDAEPRLLIIDGIDSAHLFLQGINGSVSDESASFSDLFEKSIVFNRFITEKDAVDIVKRAVLHIG